MSATAQTDQQQGVARPYWSGVVLRTTRLPVPGLTQLEATAIQIMLAGRPVKVLAAYLSPSRPLMGADLDACFGGGLPVLMAGDLNAKHVDWNSQLSTRTGKLLRDYADGNPCFIFGPDPNH